MMSGVRVFIAVDTPSDIKAQIVQVQQKLKECGADVRWEPPEKLHATIKFLGDTADEKSQPIAVELEKIAARYSQFAITYAHLGCFPNLHSPRVVWIGIDEATGVMGNLFSEIDRAMEQFGYERESRAFHPHLTLGRVRGPRNIRRLLATVKTVTFQSEQVLVSEIMLVRSDLKPTGSVYTPLKKIPLKT